MNWLNRIIGASASRKTLSQLGAIREEIAQLVDVGRKKAIARLGAIREAIGEDGDDTGTLQSLLRQSMDLNTHDSIPPVYPIMLGGNGVMISRNDTLPLILAALHHKPERARLLLQRGARVDVTCGHGRTPLHWAVAGYADSTLLNTYELWCRDARAAGKPPEPIGWIGPDDQAASLATTKLLLECGADPDATDSLGHTVLHRASSVGGKAEHLRLLLQRGASVNAETDTGATPLMLAARCGAEDVVAVLLEAGADPNRADASRVTPLHWACAQRYHGVVGQLLAAHADPRAMDDEGISPIQIAHRLGEIELLQVLLEADASRPSPAERDEADPMMAGPPAGPDQPAGLIFAAAAGDLRGVRELLSRGQVAIEARTPDGWTALHEAVVHGAEMTRLFLEAGANANVASRDGYTPLHRAAAKGLPEVMELLVQHGADVWATDANGNGLARFAEASGDAQTIALAAGICGDLGHPPVRKASGDEFFDQIERSIARAPQFIELARAAGWTLVSGGDGYAPETAVVIDAPDVGCGVALIYGYLDDRFGPRRAGTVEVGHDGERGWRLIQAHSEALGERHLTCLEIALTDDQRLKRYFDVTQWCSLDASLALLMAHACINKTDSVATQGGVRA
jgi:ankyrin repeat protein